MTRRADGWDDAGCLARPELPWIADASAGAYYSPQAADMATVCASCLVRSACAELAEQTRARAGFWAGRWRGANGRWLLTPAERQAVARKAAVAAAAARTGVAADPRERWAA